MADASSADCKKFIKDNAAAMGWPEDGAWKRRSKTKFEEGWLRVFEHKSGVEITIAEPEGSGAAGLRVAAGSSLAKSEASRARESYAAAPEGERSAMLWIDAMRVIGGKRSLYTLDTGVCDHEGKPKDWARFAHDQYNHWEEGAHWAEEALQRWVEEAMADPIGRPLILSRVRWCFAHDADYREKTGYWNPGAGVDIFAWPIDADGDTSMIPNPVYEMGYDNQM